MTINPEDSPSPFHVFGTAFDYLFEIRIDTGLGYRVYFGRVNPETIVLLWGGDKSTQQSDIEKATQYWNDYRSQP